MAKKQANQYDRIFKENIEAVIPGLIDKLLGIKSVVSEELPDDIQHTKERKPDVLKKITDLAQNTFILHLEIQLADEPDMVYRMADYDLMLHRKYRLPVEQYVFYIGSKKPQMPTRYSTKRHQFEFPLIVLAEVDYHLFLDSDNPEEIVFAILGDFKNEKPLQAVENILNRVYATTKGDFALRRHLVQLRILAQLRKLEATTETVMERISQFFNEEKDFLFAKGLDKGMTQKEHEKNLAFTKSLIVETAFDNQKIADFVGVPISFVKQVRESLTA